MLHECPPMLKKMCSRVLARCVGRTWRGKRSLSSDRQDIQKYAPGMRKYIFFLVDLILIHGIPSITYSVTFYVCAGATFLSNLSNATGGIEPPPLKSRIDEAHGWVLSHWNLNNERIHFVSFIASHARVFLCKHKTSLKVAQLSWADPGNSFTGKRIQRFRKRLAWKTRVQLNCATCKKCMS